MNFTGLGTGQSATFNPATGFITVIPEPSTIASLLTGLAIGGSSVCRRRKQV
ncbi:MAG: PEP-CTERM sorting domain-containing protein [Planctomycetes bacterium]|nr:PEP-CTERM sorting domain-containing protein [Planctomycetota bacterium]